MNPREVVNLTCAVPLYAWGRYLFVAANASENIFHLAEVEVYDGRVVACSPQPSDRDGSGGRRRLSRLPGDGVKGGPVQAPQFPFAPPGQCVFECDCSDTECVNIHLVILSAPDHSRKLCEIFIM
ncbi:hypothetical protein NP493_3151g00003 [Ridgeia piscesae]|uniref:Uncharacterized protein n=1 Tax=Ridgeia piscesae TaxID=27915 RepID=A0AAD9J9L6_RIDPI|nr:hypothetical protein NP493_3151g00003 [Ridgeia piscesae]